MQDRMTIYDADPALRLSRVTESLSGVGERVRHVQRLRKASPGGARILAAFGGEQFLSQAREFLAARGDSGSDLLIVHLDKVSQADAVLVMLQMVRTHDATPRALMAPSPEALLRLVHGHQIGIPDQVIVDARVEGRTLFLTDAELQRHIVDCDHVRALRGLSTEALSGVQVDEHGRFLAWPAHDVELTLHGLRQASDEAYRARTALSDLQRTTRYGAAIRQVRENSGIRQADVPGLSERQLRRLETGESQPTLEALQALAQRHGLDLNAYLQRVAAACAAPSDT